MPQFKTNDDGQDVSKKKAGELAYFGNVEHVKQPDGSWTPSTQSEGMRDQFLKAGASLFQKLKPNAEASEE